MRNITSGAIGGRARIAARSILTRSLGRPRRALDMRALAIGNHASNCWLKSSGDVKTRPDMKRLRKKRFIRSTMPLDSGSRAFNSLICVPRVPANAAAGSVSFPRPMPVSLSHVKRVGTAPASCSSDHIPPSRSGVVRVGNMRAWMKPENVEVITNTGGAAAWS